MPANLPPQYIAAEQKLKAARDPEEKIAILEEMWSLLPKHKGTDKIQADLKRRISKLKKEAEEGKKGRKGFSISVVREGAGQIVVVGPPNSGKSSLVAALTGANLKIAPYPFTTLVPCPVMMPWLDVQVQLVDLPAIAPGHVEFWCVNIIRNSDAALLVVDASGEECLDRAEEVMGELDQRQVYLGKRQGPSSDAGQEHPDKRTILVANKIDLGQAHENLSLVSKLYADRFDLVPFSCITGSSGDHETLRRRVFELLNVIRIYPKEPGAKPDIKQPFTVRSGSTVLDFAAHVHKDFARNLKQGRVWGSARFPGQAVGREHLLRDGDIVELSM
ncbi:MAG: 50S ribosome-binding GTPase [Candidatus Aureabacteria bacterium]|nr:50S ribosome-binding GTPase [Candidatus Auribacterota bacterium]